jgi:hypothetical protein
LRERRAPDALCDFCTNFDLGAGADWHDTQKACQWNAKESHPMPVADTLHAALQNFVLLLATL